MSPARKPGPPSASYRATARYGAVLLWALRGGVKRGRLIPKNESPRVLVHQPAAAQAELNRLGSRGLAVLASEGLDDAEASLVDDVCQLVNFAGEVVVSHDGQGRGTDTQSRVNQSFRDTVCQSYGVGGAGLRQSGEGANHAEYRAEQTGQGCNRGDGRDDNQVLFQHGQLQSGAFFDFLLDSEYL